MRQEHYADAVFTQGRQDHVLTCHFLAEKPVGDLNEDARTVTRKRVGPYRTTMGEVLEDRQTLLDNRVALDASDIRHKADAACIVFVTGVVQALCSRRISVVHVKPQEF